jgi:hypothetical protein
MSSDDSRGPRAIERVQPQRDRLREAHLAFEATCGTTDASKAALLATFDELREAFAIHVAFTEGPGGLFEEMQDEAPLESATEIDRLRRDHITIANVLERVEQLVRADAAERDERVGEATTELVRLLAQHRRRGIELTYNVYGIDVGGGD